MMVMSFRGIPLFSGALTRFLPSAANNGCDGFDQNFSTGVVGADKRRFAKDSQIALHNFKSIEKQQLAPF
jgi:hypothetical protein